MRLLTSGIRLVRDNPVFSRILLALTTFSLLSLPYVGLFPAIAKLNFGIAEKSPQYNWLYATWGLGACLGALAVGTVFVEWDKRRLIRLGFGLFAISMTAFALAREPIGAFISGFLLGHRLLRNDDLDAHRVTEQAARLRTRASDEPVVHGLRGNGDDRAADLRTGRRRDRRTLGSAGGRGVGRVPLVVVRCREDRCVNRISRGQRAAPARQPDCL